MAIKFLSGLNLSNVTAGSILKLDSNGNIVAAVDGTDYNTGSADSWSDVGSDIYRNSDVRIGTYQSGVAPAARLHVFDYQTTDPKLLIEDGNTGDASMQFKISTQSYTMGIDNSDSDKFVLAASTALGTTNVLEVSTTGTAAFQDDLLVNGTMYSDAADISGRLDVASDLRIRGNSANIDQGVVRQYVNSSNTLFIDAGNDGNNVGQFKSDGSLILKSSNSQGLSIRQSANSGNDMQVEIRGSRNAPAAGVNPAKLILSSYDDDDGSGVVKTGAEFYMESTSLTGEDLSDFEVGLRYRKDGAVVDGISIHDGEVKAHGYLTVTGNELNLPSGGQLDWANGDARITEGLVTNYSLSFQTYTGSALTTKMFIQSGGNVGIGTTSPGYKLSVDDNSVTNIPKTLLQFDAASITDNGGYNIDFRTSSNDAADRYVARIRGIRESTGALSQLSFWTESGSALLQRMTIRASGNVGIGTTSPSAKLHVHHTSEEVLRIDSGTTGAIHFFENTTRRGILGYSNGTSIATAADAGDMILRAESGSKLHLAVAATSILTVSGSNIGIGTTAPSDKLHVVGNATIHSGANLGQLKVGRGDNQEIKIYVDDTNNIITAYQDSDSNSTHIFALDREFDGSGANNFFIRKGGSNQLGLDTSGNLRLYSYTAGLLKTDANGNVSLDTNTYSTATGVEDNADVTDATNVAAAGALMKAGGTMSGTLALDNADSLSFESGKHWITYNDGEGNFNIRVGHKSDSSTNEVSTETGYVFHDEWSQSSGWREFNVSGTSITAGNDVGTWRRQIFYDYNDVRLSYQGGLRLQTTSAGVTVSGNIAATNFSGSSSGTNTGDQTLSSLGALSTSGGTITSGVNAGLTINHDSFNLGLIIHRNHANNSPSITFKNNDGQLGILFAQETDNNPYWRQGTSATNHKIWHAGNDGASSGLDADLLDGNHASAFSTASGVEDNADVTDATNVAAAGALMKAGGTMTGTLKLDSELQFLRGSTDYSNYIRAANYPSQNYTSSTAKYWLEYGAKGGHHFVVNTDGGAASAENAYDDFTIWQGAVDGDRLFEVTNVGNVTTAGKLYIGTTSATTTATTALLLGAAGEVKKRGLGSNAFSSTSFLPLAGGTVTGMTIFEDGMRIGTGSHYTDGRASITFGEGATTNDSMYIEYDGENLSGDNNAIIFGSAKEGVGDIFRVTYGGSVLVGSNAVATESYVGTAISNLVDSSPAALDTLNELAAALGDDASFSTTMSTALGNRLRIDVNNQSLSSTELANARTNLGLGSAATAASTAFVAVTGDTMTGALVINEGASDQTNSADTTTLPSTTGAEFMRIEGTYTDGRYTTELAKVDRGGNLPLYIRQSKSSANSFVNLARFGDHSNSVHEFEVFGSIKATGGDSGNWNTSYTYSQVGHLPLAGGTLTGGLKITDASQGLLVDSAGHAGIRLDRGSTSYDNNILFYTAGSLKWRLWQDGSDDYLYIRDSVNSNNMVVFKKGGNVGIGASDPAAPLDVQPASDYKVTKVGDDRTSHYKFTGQSDHTLTLSCSSYHSAEVVITAHQTNGGTNNNVYIRGIWTNNHTSHHWHEIENIGGLSGSSFTITNGQSGDTTNSGELEIVHDYTTGSFAQMVARVTDHYGTHSYTIS